ncbi:MAG: aldo/keto reductase [Ktedonobacteraceae bacterium]
MQMRRLGATGTMVSELCLGCMTFGKEANEEQSRAIIQRFVEAGGNFLDTADVYSQGISEEITGRAIRELRSELVLATKVRFPMGKGPNDVGLSRKHIIEGCEASLRRLGTDYIDLYQAHCWDAATPLEETLSAFSDLVHQGKVRYIGVSNFTAWQIMKALHVSRIHGFERVVSLQPQYSLVERHLDYEILPLCREEDIAILPWSPLGGGFLSGKYKQGEQPPEGTRIAQAAERLEEHWQRRATEQNWHVIDVIDTIAKETGKSYAQIALNWLLRTPGITAPIVGARSLEQFNDNLGAVDWTLSEEQVHKLSSASAIEDIYPYRFIREAQRV